MLTDTICFFHCFDIFSPIDGMILREGEALSQKRDVDAMKIVKLISCLVEKKLREKIEEKKEEKSVLKKNNY